METLFQGMTPGAPYALARFAGKRQKDAEFLEKF
jgi:hypothetical protein